MNREVNIDTLIVDSRHLSNAISVLSNLAYERVQLKTIELDDINELNAMIAAIQCLAEKHAEDMETLERIA